MDVNRRRCRRPRLALTLLRAGPTSLSSLGLLDHCLFFPLSNNCKLKQIRKHLDEVIDRCFTWFWGRIYSPGNDMCRQVVFRQELYIQIGF